MHSLYNILRIDLDFWVSPWYTSLRVAAMLDSSGVRMEALNVRVAGSHTYEGPTRSLTSVTVRLNKSFAFKRLSVSCQTWLNCDSSRPCYWESLTRVYCRIAVVTGNAREI